MPLLFFSFEPNPTLSKGLLIQSWARVLEFNCFMVHPDVSVSGACPDNKYGEHCDQDCNCQTACSDIQGRCSSQCIPGKRNDATVLGDCTQGLLNYICFMDLDVNIIIFACLILVFKIVTFHYVL